MSSTPLAAAPAWLVRASPWLLGLSLAMFVGTLLLLPLIIVSLPADYFVRDRRPAPPAGHPVRRALLALGKNLVGLMLLLVGLAMLVLPGQGVLTILVALMFHDCPGKYQLERGIVTRRGLLAAANELRRQRGRMPLVLGDEEERDDDEAAA